MNDRQSPAHSIDLLPAPMRLESSQPDTAIEIHAAGSPRIVRLGFPGMLRKQNAANCKSDWSGLCKLTKEQGWLLKCPAPDLGELDANAIPLRLGSRNSILAFDAAEMHTSDLVEIECRVDVLLEGSAFTQWCWPRELGTTDQLANLITALRGAVGFNTPVGLTLALGNEADLELALAPDSGRPDFITLVDSHTQTLASSTLHHIARARKICNDSGVGHLPLFLQAPVSTPHEFLVCTALGASVITLDAILSPALNSTRKPSSGSSLIDSLGGNPSAAKLNSTSELEECVRKFVDAVRAQLLSIGTNSLQDLSPAQLWTADPSLAKLCGAAAQTAD